MYNISFCLPLCSCQEISIWNWFLHCSFFQVKSPAQFELSEEKQFQWEPLLTKNIVSKVKMGEYSLPVWAGTWKFMNFPYRQQKKHWDCIWPVYPQNCSSKLSRTQQLEEQVGLILSLSCFVFTPSCYIKNVCCDHRSGRTFRLGRFVETVRSRNWNRRRLRRWDTNCKLLHQIHDEDQWHRQPRMEQVLAPLCSSSWGVWRAPEKLELLLGLQATNQVG